MRECGIIDTRVDESMKGHPGIPSDILSDLFGDGSIKFNANLPRKKVCGIEFLFHIQSYNLFACLLYTVHDDLFFRQIRGHLRSLKPGDACKLLENLVSAWITRCSRLNLHVYSPCFLMHRVIMYFALFVDVSTDLVAQKLYCAGYTAC